MPNPHFTHGPSMGRSFSDSKSANSTRERDILPPFPPERRKHAGSAALKKGLCKDCARAANTALTGGPGGRIVFVGERLQAGAKYVGLLAWSGFARDPARSFVCPPCLATQLAGFQA